MFDVGVPPEGRLSKLKSRLAVLMLYIASQQISDEDMSTMQTGGDCIH